MACTSMGLLLLSALFLTYCTAQPSSAEASAKAGPGQSVSHGVIVVNGQTVQNTYTKTGTDTWDQAPACPSPLTNPVTYDQSGRPWSYASDKSCKVVGNPPGQTTTFATAPRCTGTPTSSNSTPDKQGLLWGWDAVQKVSCAFRDGDGKPLSLPKGARRAHARALHQAAATSAKTSPAIQAVSDVVIVIRGQNTTTASNSSTQTDSDWWATAPICPLHLLFKIVYDRDNRPWSWDPTLPTSNKSCRVLTNPNTFATAVRCSGTPTVNNSVADPDGLRWGWSSALNASCAYKDVNGKPLPLTLTARRSLLSDPSWEALPACKAAPNKDNSHAGKSGRLFGVEDATVCAFKSEVYGTATFYDGYVNPTKAAAATPTSLPANTSTPFANTTAATNTKSAPTWETAAACTASPTALNSVKDESARLWGWENGAGCVFKTQAGLPIYYAATLKPALTTPAAPSNPSNTTAAIPASPNTTAPAAGPGGAATPNATALPTPAATAEPGVLGEWKTIELPAANTTTTSPSAPAAAAPNNTNNTASAAPGSYEAAPVCKQALSDWNYEIDRSGRKWGWAGSWTNGHSCKFVGPNGEPLFADVVTDIPDNTTTAAPTSTPTPTPAPTSTPAPATTVAMPETYSTADTPEPAPAAADDVAAAQRIPRKVNIPVKVQAVTRRSRRALSRSA